MSLSQQQRVAIVARLGFLADRAERRRSYLAEHQSACSVCGRESKVHTDEGEEVRCLLFCESGLKLYTNYATAKGVAEDFAAQVERWKQGSSEPGAAGSSGIIIPH